MPFQQMIAEMNALMAALQLALNILGIVVLGIFAVYLSGFAVLTLEKLLTRFRQATKPANFHRVTG